jgi:hypothetical protein
LIRLTHSRTQAQTNETPEAQISPNFGKIITLFKNNLGNKTKKASGIKVKKILKIDNAAVAQANRWCLNYLCRI